MNELVDNYNRPVDYLRISINRKCNYSCGYCDKEGYLTQGPDTVLSPDDVSAIISIFNDFHEIKKVKITGGEPLLHPQLEKVIQRIASFNSIQDISLTTNGYHLKSKGADLKTSGLDRVNISLCSLNPATFRKITGIDGLDRVLAGIDEAINVGLTPLKINFVLLKGFNERELESMLEYCATRDIRLQLIELHEIEDIHAKTHSYFASHHVDAEDVLKQVHLPIEKVEYRDMQNRKIIYFQNESSVETVKMTPSFCNNCTKLRITADGRIKPCMMKSGNELDLLGAINQGYTRQELRSLILKAVKARVPYMKQEVEECE